MPQQKTFADLTEALATLLDLPKSRVAPALRELFDEDIQAFLLREVGNKVRVVGFGVFEHRKGRSGPARNPRTGEVTVKETPNTRISFRPAKRRD